MLHIPTRSLLLALPHSQIDPKSKEKVQFVDKTNCAKHMLAHYDPQSLPAKFAGDFQPIPIEVSAAAVPFLVEEEEEVTPLLC